MYHFCCSCVIHKRKEMFRLFVFILSSTFLVSCHRHETSNDYKNAKTHPSETIAKENKKAAKKQQKDFVKQQKKNNKVIGKRGSVWGKKKKQYAR